MAAHTVSTYSMTWTWTPCKLASTTTWMIEVTLDGQLTVTEIIDSSASHHICSDLWEKLRTSMKHEQVMSWSWPMARQMWPWVQFLVLFSVGKSASTACSKWSESPLMFLGHPSCHLHLPSAGFPMGADTSYHWSKHRPPSQFWPTLISPQVCTCFVLIGGFLIVKNWYFSRRHPSQHCQPVISCIGSFSQVFSIISSDSSSMSCRSHLSDLEFHIILSAAISSCP